MEKLKPTRFPIRSQEQINRQEGGIFLPEDVKFPKMILDAIDNIELYRKISKQASKIMSTLGDDFWHEVGRNKNRFLDNRDTNDPMFSRNLSLLSFSEKLVEDRLLFSSMASAITKAGSELAYNITSRGDIGIHQIQDRYYCISPGAFEANLLYVFDDEDGRWAAFNCYEGIGESNFVKTVSLEHHISLINDIKEAQSVS